MESSLIAAVPLSPPNANGLAHRRNPVHPLGGPPRVSDSVQFGIKPLDQEQSMRVILENAYAKIQGVVDDARVALGIEPGTIFDTSPEATANRIADFALNFFELYQKNNPGVEGQEARENYAQFIGEAIQQGIEEARAILEALSAIDENTNSGISIIENIIQDRLAAFVAGE